MSLNMGIRFVKTVPQLENTSLGRQSSLVTRDSIKVHIEELVLHGFVPGDRRQIAHALQAELARLMSRGDPREWRQNAPLIERINGGTFKVEAGAKPDMTGTEIARAVFGSLHRQARASMKASRIRPGLGGLRA